MSKRRIYGVRDLAYAKLRCGLTLVDIWPRPIRAMACSVVLSKTPIYPIVTDTFIDTLVGWPAHITLYDFEGADACDARASIIVGAANGLLETQGRRELRPLIAHLTNIVVQREEVQYEEYAASIGRRYEPFVEASFHSRPGVPLLKDVAAYLRASRAMHALRAAEFSEKGF